MLIWDVSYRMEWRTASILSSFFKVIFHILCVYPDSPQQALQEAEAASPPHPRNRKTGTGCVSALPRSPPVSCRPVTSKEKSQRKEASIDWGR